MVSPFFSGVRRIFQATDVPALARCHCRTAEEGECVTFSRHRQPSTGRHAPRRHCLKSDPKQKQWLTDLEELQAAGSSPSKETVMQSLKTVTGGIRDLKNVNEITDLLAPKIQDNSAIERKAAAIGR